MRSVASNHSEAHGRAWARPISGSTGCRAPASNHHQFHPERLPSLKARVGCAVHRRHSGARAVAKASGIWPPIDHTRRISLGRCFESATEFMHFIALERAGLGPGIAAQVAAQFVTPQGKIPAADPMHQPACKLTDASEVVHVQSLSQKATLAAGVLNGCQQGMPKNWESLPKRRVE